MTNSQGGKQESRKFGTSSFGGNERGLWKGALAGTMTVFADNSSRHNTRGKDGVNSINAKPSTEHADANVHQCNRPP